MHVLNNLPNICIQEKPKGIGIFQNPPAAYDLYICMYECMDVYICINIGIYICMYVYIYRYI
jgi:hypothetical protein